MTTSDTSKVPRIKGEIYYKSRQSYENQKGCFRRYFNQVREDKNARYKKVCTKNFDSLIDEMKYYSNMEYICAGLNSFERECVIVDCDDTDFGKKSFDLMKAKEILPNFKKVKPNGHSQFFFFVPKFLIGAGWFDNGKYYEVDYTEEHRKWKRLTKLMNVMFNGDVGYTGYNCQNPFYENGDVVAIRPLNNLYTVDSLLEKLEGFLADPEILDEVNATVRNHYAKRKPNLQKAKRELKKIHFLDEELAEINKQESLEALKIKLKELEEKRQQNSQEARQIKKQIDKLEGNTINKRIFVLTTQVCKSFWKRGLLHDKKEFDLIVNTCLSNWKYQDEAEGYTFYELKQRICNDIYEIQQRDLHNLMEWDKAGYTDIQREKSLITRRKKMTLKRNRVKKIFDFNIRRYKGNKMNFILNDIAGTYKKQYNETISPSMIRIYLFREYGNIVLYLKSHGYRLNFSVTPHNNKLKFNKNYTIRNTSKMVLRVLYRYKNRLWNTERVS